MDKKPVAHAGPGRLSKVAGPEACAAGFMFDKYYTENKMGGAKPYCWYKVFLV